MAFMTNVINRENLLSPFLVSKKTWEKKKTQTVTKPKPKSQGLEVSRARLKKGKKVKTQKSTLVQTIIQLAKEKVPSGDTDTSHSAKPTNPQNIEGHIQFDVKRLPSTNPNEGTRKTKPLPEGTTIDPKDSGETYKSLIGVNLQLWLISQWPTLMEPDTEPFILNTFKEIQALLEDSKEELKDESDEEMYEVGKEMDEEEPTSTKQQSHSLNKDHPESSKAKKSDNSPDASDSESSSCSETFKPFENYVPVTERVLVRNLQGFSEVLYAQIDEDNWEKHEEAAAFYADLK
ncbi:hypothetical protein Tco_1449369 [Tanacetum coccineum]